ncbi:NACHT domain-containing protein [Streptomyces sp. ISL-43]|uniref:NACHT domain-containing protein n=1 Tax=Streptomyces sp. ISL-43 TaxID=2819183 RepID=UPI001BE5005F|nr:NACHT domain-containing protein [Streptomyces sp. ISL-43]MBT2446184.1 NACHT domain-containing protein [Streptomyces sp. ISL-43]
MKRRVLMGLGTAWAVLVMAGLVWHYRHGVKTDEDLLTGLSLLVALVTLPAVLWASLRPGKVTQSSTPLVQLADRLTEAVRRQWEQEARVRGLNDPQPLSLSWTSAGAELVQPWSSLLDLAENWPGGPPGDPARWAAGPEGLAGRGGEIYQVFRERIPTRRMVVLGEPGAGKTVLLVLLLLALIEDRQPGAPVPVLFSLASWDPGQQDLYAWMADQLTRDHRALRAPAHDDLERPSNSNLADALLRDRLILPVLDGLDELPEALRPQALAAINSALPLRQSLVLSSRTTEYCDALHRSDGFGVTLNGAAGIRLLPLDDAQVTACLQEDAGMPGAAATARWHQVVALLGTEAPAALALSTPLGLFLARTIYNPRPGERLADVAHPDELLDPQRFPTRVAIESHLFAAFIPAAYRPPTRWKAEQAERTLKFLASHLEYTRGGTPDLAWWQLHNALPSKLLARVWGCTAALMTGLAAGFTGAVAIGLETGIAAAVLVGPAFGVGVGIGIRSRAYTEDRPPTAGVFFLPDRTAAAMAVTAALVVGLLVTIRVGLRLGFAAALVGGLGAWLWESIITVPPDPTTAVGPRQVLAQDRRAFWITALLSGSLGAVALALLIVLKAFHDVGLRDGLWWGLMVTPVIGLWVGCVYAVWWRFLVVRLPLAVLGQAPWRLMGFLADAHEHRRVLRQAGAVYQFRHLNLQRHLAAPPPQQPWSSGPVRDRPDRS